MAESPVVDPLSAPPVDAAVLPPAPEVVAPPPVPADAVPKIPSRPPPAPEVPVSRPLDPEDSPAHMWARVGARLTVVAVGGVALGVWTAGGSLIVSMLLSLGGLRLGWLAYTNSEKKTATHAYAKMTLWICGVIAVSSAVYLMLLGAYLMMIFFFIFLGAVA